ncbi:MAG TPA: TonB-dependent receptor [Burkholderiaceae bacterium]|nr:TonB-dependent receptor [Burkholderiaceae bacterium]
MRKLPSRSCPVRTARKLRLRESAVALTAGAALGFATPGVLAEQGAASSPASEAPVAQATGAPPAQATGTVVAQATAAPAQPVASADDSGPEAIIVTARKRNENLKDIPESIQVIPSSLIDESHMVQLDDISSVVSNVNMFEAHDNSPAAVVRGIGAFEVYNGVGFFLNDTQLFEGQTVRPNDVERIEVLKGPQGTLYGGSNIGGAIKYVGKDPTKSWQNEVTAEVGSYWARNGRAVLSGPISDTLGVRLSVYDDNQDGYITDTYHDQSVGASYDRGGRLTLLAKPEASTLVRLSFNYDDYDSQNENLQYRVEGPPAFITITAPGQYLPYTADAYRHLVDDYFLPSFTRKLYSTTLHVEHEFSDNLKLTSITNQFWSLNRGITDFTKQPVPIDKLFQNQDQRVLSEELRLASASHTDLDWLIGAFVQQHKLYINNSDDQYAGDPTNPAITGYDYDTQNSKQNEYALFGDATYYWGRWQYELGLRAENYKTDFDAMNNPGPPGGGFPTPATLVVMPQQSLSKTELSPRVSVQYKLSAQTNVYGSYARGYQPATLTEQFLKIFPVKAETANSYELGVKTTLPHGIQVKAAAFFINYADRVYQTFKDIAGQFLDVTTNIGNSHNSGFEMDFFAPLSRDFKLSGGLGTTRAVWGNVVYSDPQLTGTQPCVFLPNPCLAPPPVFRNLHGLTAPFTPAYSANLALDWNHVFSDGYRVGARVDGQAIGQSYWDPNDFARQKAYQLMNFGAHLDKDDWTFIAHVSNLTGTKYNTMYWDLFDVGGSPQNPPFRSFGRINRPRMTVASVTYHF